MAVNFHRDSWVCVAELLANIQDIRPIAEELRSEGVSQIVKPDVPKARLAQYPLEVPLLHVVHICEIPTMVRKDPFREFIPALFHCLFLHLAAKVAQGFQ